MDTFLIFAISMSASGLLFPALMVFGPGGVRVLSGGVADGEQSAIPAIGAGLSKKRGENRYQKCYHRNAQLPIAAVHLRLQWHPPLLC